MANMPVRRLWIFCAVFALTVVCMSGTLSHNRHMITEEPVSLAFGPQANLALRETAVPQPLVILQSEPDEAVFAYRGDYRLAIKADSTGVAANTFWFTNGEFVYSDQIPLSYDLQKYTYSQCVQYGLEYELVLAIMWRESRFVEDAVNINSDGTQDSGIMQINDINKSWLLEKYGIDDLMDPYQNIRAGTAMLGNFSKKYGERAALMAYQYGETGMAEKLEEGVTTNDKIELLYRQRDYYRNIVA